MVSISSNSLTNNKHTLRLISRRPLTYLCFMVILSTIVLYICLQIQPENHHHVVVNYSQKKKQQQQRRHRIEEPKWIDIDKNPDTFGSITLTGSHYLLSGEEDYYSGSSTTGTLKVHYPTVDLQHVIPEDIINPTTIEERILLLKEKKQQHHLSYPKPIIRVGESAIYSSHAILTRCGYKGGVPGGASVNQDRVFLVKEEEEEGDSSSHFRMMGLFDGHGPDGHQTSHYATLHMPHLLEKHLKEKTKSDNDDEESFIKSAITDTFLEIDENCPEGGDGGSGSTGILLYQSGTKLYIANTGDSFAFIAGANEDDDDGTTTEILYQTTPHKPHHEEEKKRIESMGGVVQAPPQAANDDGFDYSSRVIFALSNGMTLGLAMSRSIGDHGATKFGVIANPTIDVLDLKELSNNNKNKQLYAIVVSDGLFDHIHALEIARHLATKKRPLLEKTEELILKASDYWRAMQGNGMAPYRDDISIAVTKLSSATTATTTSNR